MGSKVITNIRKVLRSTANRLFGAGADGKPAELTASDVRSLLSVYTIAQTDTAISSAVSALVASSPATLDTLNELASALGNDANFATTVSASIGAKYTKPGTGIPASDMSSAVQTSLGKADSALQSLPLHTHGGISNSGAIGTTAGLPIVTGASGVLQAGAFGATAGSICQGNDARLIDARTPTAHTHAIGTDITGLATGVASFLGTPNSANLRAALTDETGTGAAVFADNPTLTRLTFAGAISTTAWTTNGVGIAHASRTITDTSSSGTVAAAYTNVLGGNTIAASAATTFTKYASLYVGNPTAGTNVTITNPWSIETQGGILCGASLGLSTNAGGWALVSANNAALGLFLSSGIGFGGITLRNTGSGYDNISCGSGNRLAWTTNGNNGYSATVDAAIGRDSVNTVGVYTTATGASYAGLIASTLTATVALASQNGTSPGEIYVSNTFTSATNFERLRIRGQAAGNYQMGPASGSAGGSTARQLEIGYFDPAGAFVSNVRMGNAANNLTFVRPVTHNSTVTFLSTFNGAVGTINLTAGADAADGCYIGVGGSEFFSMDASFNGTQRWYQGGAVKMTLAGGEFSVSGSIKAGIKLFSALPAASASQDKIFTVSDRSGRPLAKSDGTNWYNVFTGAVLT